MSTVEATLSARQKKEQELLQDDTEVRDLVVRAVADASGGINIGGSITAGEVLRTIEGASQVTITVHDLERSILRNQLLEDVDKRLKAIDIYLDGLWFRLVKTQKQGDDLVFTFEDRDVSYLRQKRGPRKIGSRKSPGHPKGVTRAEAILVLIRSVKAHKIPVKIHELHTPQPVAKLTDQQREDRRDQDTKDQDRSAGGFDSGAKIAGINKRQMGRIAKCLEVADQIGAGDRAVLAMLCAMGGESEFGENRGARGTTFQTTKIPESQLKKQARHFLLGGESFREGSVKVVRDHPLWTVGQVASYVEVSDQGGPHYQRYFTKARAILDAWSGSTTGPGKKTYRKRYEFAVDKKETYWDAIQRMADEVHWRAFFVSGRFYYISEEDMFKLRARYRLHEQLDGVVNIDFDVDHRKKVDKAVATVRIDRWAIPPGTTVILEGMGIANGKYLVESVTRGLFSAEATVNLKRPSREKLEPRTEDAQRKDDSSGKPGGALNLAAGLRYPMNIKGKLIATMADHHKRAWGNWQSDDAIDIAVPMGTNLYAVESGRVIRLGGSWSGGSGNPDGYNVTIDTGTRQWFYTHIKWRSPQIRVGDKIAEGDYIGESGAANNVEHLHIAVNQGDPERLLGWKSPMGPPTPKSDTDSGVKGYRKRDDGTGPD